MNKKKVILSSMASIALCASLVTGATYALFTSESVVNIAVTSGKVEILATVDNLQYKTLTIDTWTDAENNETQFDGIGGSAKLDGGSVVLDKIVPGDAVKFDVIVESKSNVAVMYRTQIVNDILKDTGLFEGLTVKIDGVDFTGVSISGWEYLQPSSAPVETVSVEIELPNTDDNNYDNQFQNTNCEINVVVEAVQGNGVLTLPAGVTEESFGTNVALDGNGTYYENFQTAVKSGASVLYLKPNATLGTVSHFDLQGDLTIYGNYATVTPGGDQDISVDTYKTFADGSEVTLNIYDLNGIAVWGERKSTATVNINLENCYDVNRIYLTGTKGVTNVSLKDCTFNGTDGSYNNTAVYTNNPGTISLDNVTVMGYAIGVNQNNKSEGTQNINVTNCTFVNCGTEAVAAEEDALGYAAPIRVVASAYDSAVSNLTVNDCEFIYTKGQSALFSNILVGDQRPGKENNGTVNVTVDGVAYDNFVITDSVADLSSALASGENAAIVLGEGEYKMPSTSSQATFLISGTKDTVVDVTVGAYLDSATVAFEGVTIKGSTGYVYDQNGNKGSDYAALYTPNVTYTDCTFDGPFRVGRDGAKFINCTFTNLGNDYVWTYGNDVEFIGCTFETDGKAILIYNDGGNEVSKVTVKNCVFKATTGAKAGAINNQNCAAIEIHNYGNGVDLVASDNTVDTTYFSGEWRIKDYVAGGDKVIVNGVEYTSIAIDGKTMTIDADKNVTVNG